jgi:MFS family permease
MAFQRQSFLGLQGKALARAITFCSASCFFLFGYDQGVMGSIISTPYFLDALSIAPKDPNTISTIVSIYDIGNMVGCIVAALVGGRLGRKKTIAIGCGIAIVGAAIQTCSYSVAQMIVGRIVTGVGNGMNTATIPTWVAETSGANNRGQLIAAQLSMVAFGSVIAYFMNYGFFHLTGQIVWRFPIAFQIVFVLVTLVLLPFLPESPRFLYAKGSHDEADTVLSALRGLPRDHEALQADRAEILAAIEVEDKAGAFSFKTLINDKSGQKIPQRMVLVALIQVIQEMTGVPFSPQKRNPVH